MAKETRTLLVATTSAVVPMPDGSGLPIQTGRTFLWSDHPAVLRFPEWFRAVAATYETPAEPPIEQATAAPGEKRGR